jgi:hypothetical protein
MFTHVCNVCIYMVLYAHISNCLDREVEKVQPLEDDSWTSRLSSGDFLIILYSYVKRFEPRSFQILIFIHLK